MKRIIVTSLACLLSLVGCGGGGGAGGASATAATSPRGLLSKWTNTNSAGTIQSFDLSSVSANRVALFVLQGGVTCQVYMTITGGGTNGTWTASNPLIYPQEKPDTVCDPLSGVGGYSLSGNVLTACVGGQQNDCATFQ